MASTINFSDYDFIGFDMDFTLARYHLLKIFNVAYDSVCHFLVTEKDYHASVFHKFSEEKDLIFKGLIVDFTKGNALKLGKDGYILRATHGTKKLTKPQIEKHYGKKRKFEHFEVYASGVRSHSTWRFFDNYFDIPGLMAYAAIIDHMDSNLKQDSPPTEQSYIQAWRNVLESLERLYMPTHFSANKSPFFNALKADVSKFIDELSKPTKDWLKVLGQGKRKVFLLTTSYPDFAQLIMEAILGKEWKSYFDLRLFGARKPKFFTEEQPFVIAADAMKSERSAAKLQLDGDFCFGNHKDLMAFFRAVSRKQDPKVIYFGDNIWADSWPSKTISRWDTVLVVEEMDGEGYRATDEPGKELAVREYRHSSLLTDDELVLMNSNFWGSLFSDESMDRNDNLKTGKENKMNTCYGILISQLADICVPSIEYLSGVQINTDFKRFTKKPGNTQGFHPGCPRTLVSSP